MTLLNKELYILKQESEHFVVICKQVFENI